MQTLAVVLVRCSSVAECALAVLLEQEAVRVRLLDALAALELPGELQVLDIGREVMHGNALHDPFFSFFSFLFPLSHSPWVPVLWFMPSCFSLQTQPLSRNGSARHWTRSCVAGPSICYHYSRC